MMQVVEQTRDEKVAMYMKLTKRELAEMLLVNIDVLRRWEEARARETLLSGTERIDYYWLGEPNDR